MALDFDQLQSDVMSWYEHGDQQAATHAVRAMEPAVRAMAKGQQGSWGEQQVEDTTAHVLRQLLDADRRPLQRPKKSFSGLFWRAAKNAVLSEGRKLSSRKTLSDALAAESAGQRPMSQLPGAASSWQDPAHRLSTCDGFASVERALLGLAPKRTLALLAELAGDYGPDAFVRAREAAAGALGREDLEVRAALDRARSGIAAAKAKAALGPEASVNAFQQSLSRARTDLRRTLAEEAL